MGVSTDGQICYGIKFDEDFEFPWANDNEAIEGWWRKVNGYIPPFQLYDEDGDYVGKTKPATEKIVTYYQAQGQWDAAHPLPIELVNVCSMSSPIYILADASTVVTARRGYPEEINPATMFGDRDLLLNFCKKYDIDTDGAEPKWYLSSFWEV